MVFRTERNFKQKYLENLNTKIFSLICLWVAVNIRKIFILKMRIFLALILCVAIDFCFALNCAIGQKSHFKSLSLKLKSCHIEYQKIDIENATIADKTDSEVKSFEIISNLEVKFLPEKIAKKLPNLIEYEVRYCAVTKIDGRHFKYLLELENLDLRHNKIEIVANDSFKDLEKLSRLDLGHNKIIVIDPKWFSQLMNLGKLWLDFNKIEVLNENTFEILTNLHFVSLDNNKLTTIPDNLFKNNLELRDIWLRHNQIRDINSTIFDHLTEFQNADLRHNYCGNKLFTKNSEKTEQVPGIKEDLKNCTHTLVENDSHRFRENNFYFVFSVFFLLFL